MKTTNAVLCISSIILALLATAIIDRLLIRPWADSIAIPRSTRMFYETPEFKYIADINSLGFRDREWSSEKDDDQIRIAVLGDSFTFGWGVAEEESWPRILENKLRERGYRAVVMNLAQPGYFPYMYAQYASIYLPALKPDIVLVGVLQGDDLVQMAYGDCSELKNPSSPGSSIGKPDRPAEPKPTPGRVYLKNAMAVFLPNTLRAYSYKKRTQSENVYAIWRSMAEGICSKFSAEQSARFAKLDEQVKRMFLRGELNPSLVQAGVLFPDIHCNVWDLNSGTTRDLINRMAKCLEATQQNSSFYGARATAVLSIPYGMYVSERSYQNWTRIGWKLLPEMLTANNADMAINMACKPSGIPFVSVTEDFRAFAASEELYFSYDGHFTARGHAVYAGLIEPHVAELIVQAGK